MLFSLRKFRKIRAKFKEKFKENLEAAKFEKALSNFRENYRNLDKI